MIRGQKSSEKYKMLNPIEIKIEDNHVIHMLKNAKNETYCFTPIGLLFSSGIKKMQIKVL